MPCWGASPGVGESDRSFCSGKRQSYANRFCDSYCGRCELWLLLVLRNFDVSLDNCGVGQYNKDGVCIACEACPLGMTLEMCSGQNPGTCINCR